MMRHWLALPSGRPLGMIIDNMLDRSLRPRVREIAHENPKFIILFYNGAAQNELQP